MLKTKIYLAGANTRLAFKELRFKQEAAMNRISQQKMMIYSLLCVFFLAFFGGLFVLVLRKKSTKVNLIVEPHTMEVVEKLGKIINHSHKCMPESLIKQLDYLIHIEKIYLNKGLTLVNLSNLLHTNTTYLFQIFNQTYKVGFHDNINELRVKEACRLLMTPMDKNITIDHIIPMAGFSTKSSFYGIFKKFTGVSPVQFKATNRQEK